MRVPLILSQQPGTTGNESAPFSPAQSSQLPRPLASATVTALYSSLLGFPQQWSPNHALTGAPSSPPVPATQASLLLTCATYKGQRCCGSCRAEGRLTTRTCPGRIQASVGVQQGPWSKGAPARPSPPPQSSHLGPDPPARPCRAPPHLHVSPLQPCGQQPGSRCISRGIGAGGRARWKQLQGESGRGGG